MGFKYQSSGFTLIELLVVIAIIGMLAGIVTLSMNSSRDNARYAAVALQLRQIERAFFGIYADRGCWPRTSNTGCGGVSTAEPTIAALIANPDFGLRTHLSVVPEFPFNHDGAGYRYDNNNDATAVPCAGTSVADPGRGVNIQINGVHADVYRQLNTIFDGDANPNEQIPRRCGRVRFTGTTGIGNLYFNISPHP